MEIRDVFALWAAYIFVYYAVAKYVVKMLEHADPSYFEKLDTRRGASGKNSLAIAHVLFDSELPKVGYPVKLKRALYAARIMLLLGPAALIALLMAM